MECLVEWMCNKFLSLHSISRCGFPYSTRLLLVHLKSRNIGSWFLKEATTISTGMDTCIIADSLCVPDFDFIIAETSRIKTNYEYQFLMCRLLPIRIQEIVSGFHAEDMRPIWPWSKMNTWRCLSLLVAQQQPRIAAPLLVRSLPRACTHLSTLIESQHVHNSHRNW